MRKLRIGEIPFTNLFPIFHGLKEHCGTRPYEFVQGYPSALNKMLRHSMDIDVSPSSSIEYLRDRDNYVFIPGHSISSTGAVQSILLFTRTPIETLDNHEVFVTHMSETSPVLLDVIAKKFFNITLSLTVTDKPVQDAIMTHSACLSIGDEALLAASRAHAMDISGEDYCLLTINQKAFYTYDLGSLWHRMTGLPFVFALWIHKNNADPEIKALIKNLSDDLDTVKPLALSNLGPLSKLSPLGREISANKVAAYWRKISYDLSGEHLKGLELFEKYAKELGHI